MHHSPAILVLLQGKLQGRILIPKEEPEYEGIWDEIESFCDWRRSQHMLL